MKRRFFALALALLLAVSLPVSALAATWYLEDGNITISATENGQTVKQGDKDAVEDDAPVIKQRDSEKATDKTIKIETTGGATADVTIENVNIKSDGDAIDVGSSRANITLKGDNKLLSESGSALHVSSGDVTIDGDGTLEAEIGGSYNNDNNNAKIGSHENEDMSGSIHITGDATVTTKDDRDDDYYYSDGAGIGSGKNGKMSGSITIDENATVDAFSREEGAGIGSGYGGGMSGNISISGSAQVTAGSGWDGAGIGAGEDGTVSGTITIDGNAQVTAWSKNGGAGIGSGEDGNMSGNITIGDNARVTSWSEDEGSGIGSGQEGNVSGTITIGGNAQVTAGSDDDGAGIGAGEDGSIAGSGKIIIRDNATVVAIGEDNGAGIGASEGKEMSGTIIIQDNAQVTAIAGDCAAAIGSDNKNDMTGTILILGNARITTGMEDGVSFNSDTGKITYTLEVGAIGRIGDGQDSNHTSEKGHYVIGPDVTINGISGSDIDALKEYINMRLSGENHDGEPENLTKLEIRSENGKFTVSAYGEGTVEKILYGGSETVPTAPGTYPVTCVVRLGNETLEFQIGTFIVPEPPAAAAEAAQPAPVYRVTDKDGNQISYTAAREGGVLTIRTDAAYARLTLTAAEAQALTAQGVEKVVFVTSGATSAFSPAGLTAQSAEGPFVLTHDGETVTFTAGDTDLAALLVQE